MQALGAVDLLHRLACGWATDSRGSMMGLRLCQGLPAGGCRGGLDDTDDGWQARALVRQGMIKGPFRAAEKVLECYGGDVSRLVDVTRCRLIFGDVEDIIKCLQVIGSSAADRMIRMVRVKNTMWAGWDSRAGAGFRVRPSESPHQCTHSPRIRLSRSSRCAFPSSRSY